MDDIRRTNTAEVQVDLRAVYPIAFGDDHTRQLYDRELAAVRARLRDGELAVSPRTELQTKRGLLRGGEVLTAADIPDELDSLTGEVKLPAAARLRLLLRDGRVLEKL